MIGETWSGWWYCRGVYGFRQSVKFSSVSALKRRHSGVPMSIVRTGGSKNKDVHQIRDLICVDE